MRASAAADIKDYTLGDNRQRQTVQLVVPTCDVFILRIPPKQIGVKGLFRNKVLHRDRSL